MDGGAVALCGERGGITAEGSGASFCSAVLMESVVSSLASDGIGNTARELLMM